VPISQQAAHEVSANKSTAAADQNGLLCHE
jgi:hypothetical protein